MIELPQVTLISISTQNVEQAARALEYSCSSIKFGEVKLVSPYRPECASYIHHDRIDPFTSIDDWNHYLVYWLYIHVNTPFALLVHPDGFVINSDSWRPEFLDYDYIGSPWSLQCAYAIQGGRDQQLSRVGNSVGIRSKRLMELPRQIGMEWKRFNADSNEDTFISCHNRKVFEEHGCTFAPFELAMEFGREEDIPECQYITHPFLFHKYTGRNINYPRV